MIDHEVVGTIIHDWVSSVTPFPEISCSLYAVAGARLLCMLSPKEYLPIGGTFDLWISEGTEDDPRPYYLTFDAHNPLIFGKEFHAWIVQINAESKILQVVDYSARHYQSHSQRLSLPWQRQTEDFLVGTLEELAEKKAHFRPEPKISKLILEETLHRYRWAPILEAMVKRYQREARLLTLV